MAELPEKKNRASKQQLIILLDYIEDNPSLKAGIITTANVHLWNDLARDLNSVIGGSVRGTEEWVKCWNNVKSRALRRQSSLQRKYDDEDAVPLTPNHLRVLHIMGDQKENALEENEFLRERSPIRYQGHQPASTSNGDESTVVSTRQVKKANKTPGSSSRIDIAGSKINVIQTSDRASSVLCNNQSPILGRKEVAKKRTPITFSGFKFLLSAPEVSNSAESAIIDLTKEESPNMAESLNLLTEESALCNHCTKVLQEYFTKQNVILENGFKCIGQTLAHAFNQVTKNHRNGNK